MLVAESIDVNTSASGESAWKTTNWCLQKLHYTFAIGIIVCIGFVDVLRITQGGANPTVARADTRRVIADPEYAKLPRRH